MPSKKFWKSLRQLPVTLAAIVFSIFLLGVAATVSLMPEMPGMSVAALVAVLVSLAGFTTGVIVLLTRAKARPRAADPQYEGLLDVFPCPALITDRNGKVLQFAPMITTVLTGVEIGAPVFGFFGEHAPRAHTLLADCLAGRQAQGMCALTSDSYATSLARLGQGRVLWTFCNRTVVEEMPLLESYGEAPRLTLGRNGAILWMNNALRQMLGGTRRHARDAFVDPPVEHGRLITVRTNRAIRQYLAVELSREAGRRDILLVSPPAGTQRVEQPEIERLPVAILTCNADGALLSANRAARRLIYGDEATVRPLPVHLSGLLEGLGRSLTDWLKQVCDGQAPGQPEFMRLLEQDTERYVQVTLTPQLNGQDLPRVMVVLNDATDLKVMEAKFTQTQKMQAIGQLAGGVAHDFNNLLTAISGHCDLLLLRHEPQDPEYADLIQIAQNSNRAAALVSQLLAFSRKQTLNPERLDVGATLSDLTHLLNRLVGEKVNLKLQQKSDTGPIRADKRQLEQVLMNLVVNARDAMPEGGEVRITASEQVLDMPIMRDRAQVPAGRYVMISVEDDGTGIPYEHQSKVFEPFFTSKKAGEGTGLGLSTAYGIVKQSGGYIFLSSTPGQGTRFDIMLPVYGADLAPVENPAPEPVRIRHGDGRVLLVEDEAPVRAFASRALRMRGYEVVEAASAEEALRHFATPDFSVDVVVTDVIMPGMDGPTWVAEAMRTRPDLRVVFVSGYAEEIFGDAKKIIANSVFLPKPFSLTDLTATVQEQMGEAAAA